MPQDDEQRQVIRKSGLVYAAVFSFFGSVLACLLIGWVLDRWLETSPWLVVSGIVLGSIVGFYQFIRVISKIT